MCSTCTRNLSRPKVAILVRVYFVEVHLLGSQELRWGLVCTWSRVWTILFAETETNTTEPAKSRAQISRNWVLYFRPCYQIWMMWGIVSGEPQVVIKIAEVLLVKPLRGIYCVDCFRKRQRSHYKFGWGFAYAIWLHKTIPLYWPKRIQPHGNAQ